MSAHTPGPWVQGNTVQHDVLLLGGPARRYVCRVTIQQAGGGIIAQSMEAEREANARLIAAAPELLEAGRGLVAALEERRAATEAREAMIGKTMPYTEIEAVRLRFVHSGEQLVGAETALRAAIAKATIQPLSGGEG